MNKDNVPHVEIKELKPLAHPCNCGEGCSKCGRKKIDVKELYESYREIFNEAEA